MSSAWECLHSATLELVRSTPIKQRLVSAYRRYLTSLPEDALPMEVRESFRHVMSSLRGVQPLRGEDAVVASVRKMSNQEADDCAALIVEIFGLTCRTHASPRVNPVVQLHSVERTAADYDVAPVEYEASILIANN
jgi:hypothetical protein